MYLIGKIPTFQNRQYRYVLAGLIFASVILFIIYTFYNNEVSADIGALGLGYSDEEHQLLISLTIQDWKKPKANSSVPLILFWTPFFGRFGHGVNKFSNCPAKCEVTDNKLDLMSSDAVIFHIRDIDTAAIPPIHPPEQVWVFYLHESPANTFKFINMTPYERIFNWTMTYRHDSDVYMPYGVTLRKDGNESSSSTYSPSHLYQPQSNETMKFSSYLTEAKIANITSKHNLVAWVVSNCETQSNRESFVEELSQYIKVDIYGNCGTLSCPNDSENRGECFNYISTKYKFYLAFENSLCTDYVTEKHFRALTLDLIPVVYGRANYTRISPPNSFIDARAFNSSKQLANYLLYLDAHDAEYVKYLKWKDEFTTTRPSKQVGWCALCQKLTTRMTSEIKFRKAYENISNWWNTHPRQPDISSSQQVVLQHRKNDEEPACLDTPIFNDTTSTSSARVVKLKLYLIFLSMFILILPLRL